MSQVGAASWVTAQTGYLAEWLLREEKQGGGQPVRREAAVVHPEGRETFHFLRFRSSTNVTICSDRAMWWTPY